MSNKDHTNFKHKRSYDFYRTLKKAGIVLNEDPGSRLPDPGPGTQNPGSNTKTLGPGLKTYKTGSMTLDNHNPGYRTWTDSDYLILILICV